MLLSEEMLKQIEDEDKPSLANLQGVVNRLRDILLETSLNAFILRPLLYNFSLAVLEKLLASLFLQDRTLDEFESRSDKAFYYSIFHSCMSYFKDYSKHPELFDLLVLQFKDIIREATAGNHLFDVNSVKIEELYEDEEFLKNLEYAKKHKQKWELLNAVDLLPKYFINLSDNGKFLTAKTKTSIRVLFGYRKSIVPDLSVLGFKESDREVSYFLLINKLTGKACTIQSEAFKWEADCVIKGSKIKYLKPKNYSVIPVKYRPIEGINVEQHNYYLEVYREITRVKYSEAHRVKHKQHKQHVHNNPHKPHNYPVKKLITDSSGNLISPKEYAEKQGVSLATVYNKIKKLEL